VHNNPLERIIKQAYFQDSHPEVLARDTKIYTSQQQVLQMQAAHRLGETPVYRQWEKVP